MLQINHVIMVDLLFYPKKGGGGVGEWWVQQGYVEIYLECLITIEKATLVAS